MTAPSLKPAGPSGLLGKLMAAVRSEFRSDVLVFAAEDPVFGGAACRVAELRAGRSRPGHVPGPSAALGRRGPPGPGRFAAIDRSAVAAAAPEPAVPGDRLRLRVRARRDVRSARAAVGTRRAPRPARVAGRPADDQATSRRARPAASSTASCGRRRRCRSATPTPTPGRSTGDPTSTCSPTASPPRSPPASEIIRLDLLAPQLRLEMQYVLQRRHDDRQGKLTPAVVMAWCGRWPPRAWRRCSTTTRTPGTSELGRPVNATRSRGVPRLRPPRGRRPGRGRRLGSRVPPRCLADAPPRLRRRPHPAIHRDPASRGCGTWPNGGCAGGFEPGWGWKPAAAGRSS